MDTFIELSLMQISNITRSAKLRLKFPLVVVFISSYCQLFCAFNIFQLAQILPMEENFLLLFRHEHPLESSVEFMKVGVNIPSCDGTT